jgi:hypothetical protein
MAYYPPLKGSFEDKEFRVQPYLVEESSKLELPKYNSSNN